LQAVIDVHRASGKPRNPPPSAAALPAKRRIRAAAHAITSRRHLQDGRREPAYKDAAENSSGAFLRIAREPPV